MTRPLDGKRALVIGGGTGIGLACAEAFLRQGASVMISGRRAAVLEAACAGLSALGPAAWRAGDGTREEDVIRVVEEAAGVLGGLDTLVVSAGISGRTPIASTAPEQFQAILDHNVRPVFLASRFAAARLMHNAPASIIAISSVFGLVGIRDRVAYCAAKAAVIGMIRAMALDLAEHRVRANAICPGFIETELAVQTAAQEPDPQAALQARRTMHPIPRAGMTEEVGAMAAYLASDAAAFVTGQALAVDGGYSAR